jgi:small subunit ribosomal protein S21
MPGVTVTVREGEAFEIALKRFRKEVERAGIIREMKRHMEYEKPSVKKKKKALAARKRWVKRMRKTSRRG